MKPITMKPEQKIHLHEVPIISEREEINLKDRERLDYSERSYSVGELEGEL